MNQLARSWFDDAYACLIDNNLSHWLETLPAQINLWDQQGQRGEFNKWCRLLAKLPQVSSPDIELSAQVKIGSSEDITEYQKKQITGLLQQFTPWRKGPFDLFGIEINTEWRSDWKWDRVVGHISPLANRKVLDVGCGSGYHLWRMYGEHARCVFGIDPTNLFLVQFQAIKHYLGAAPVHYLPLGIEQMQAVQAFDTVFSMGVLYHRKDPLQFLEQLKSQLRSGGELVLETLVVDGDERTVVMPGERYAQMRNVWFLPSVAALTTWLERLGFKNIIIADVNTTSLDEQRSTNWMTNQSLQDFLDPEDISKTIEGYPAPKRAVLVATRK
ncbi:tRNA 5-methoxyuridine(34)/uridine 5-oxyacetic acid(34) synthase CmoB [Alteromonas lipotrueiana]|uniref:tRNA 5-methoxyuridine(34)/uridine 5-oxyacetic acid(34) synthase CmoB n=1 Tax=Alteromonas lipotrueiana TaxID=2803815 RepID=UPI001C478F2B|nr:tRNA 5-methoxyuridine(34)/uridine 5-oxyacetic acid(34) synthase CmoB [Alteromonas lipotrueiana]